MHHPQAVQSPIFNYCLKVNIDGHTRPQTDTKLLLQVSVQEFHNSLIINRVDGGIKDARHSDNNIIISDSTLHSLFPPQF